ncbi:MAG: ADP-ribosylglycohydrolase family protein, partial [Niameybacter sp.]
GVMGTLERPLNNSKKCGTVIRIAPVGLVESEEDVFEVGSRVGVITHGHPSAYLASGTLATLIFYLVEGFSLQESIEKAIDQLKLYEHHESCLKCIEKAIVLAQNDKSSRENLQAFGDGFMAEDALGMALYCSLSSPDNFEEALKLAINQNGNSNSAAAITGQILGTYLGMEAINPKLIEILEICKEVEQVAEDLYVGYEDTEEWQKRYPGW